MSSVRLRSRSLHQRLAAMAGSSLLLVGLCGCGGTALSTRRARSTLLPQPTATLPANIELPTALACGTILTAGPRDSQGLALPGVLFPETANVAGSQTQTHYYSSTCAADIASFFQTQLPDDGWNIIAVQHQASQQFTERFHRGAASLDILIVGYPDGAGCYVVIQEQ